MTDRAPVIVWFRDDLRLADQAALHAAVETGRPVLPIFILDDIAPGRWTLGSASRWWLHHSLLSLRVSLEQRGAHLTLRRGDSIGIVMELVEQSGAQEIFAGGLVSPWARQVDRTLAETLPIKLHRMRTTTLFHPDSVRTKTGGSYAVYTPFANACLALGGPKPPLPAPHRIPGANPPHSERLEDSNLLPTKPDWASGLRETWTPGEASAMERAQYFLTHGLKGYATGRDRPGGDETSALSPHLHFGEISAPQLWHLAQKQPASKGRDILFREILWREFCANLLWQYPSLPDQPLRPAFARMPWRDAPDELRAWQRGHTGVPIVDAGLRQLWQIGWMHNRVRMIVASFLVKHLLLSWQAGEAWFWDTLVDADLANNAVNWQWVAGCGADASPFFRIFNPVLQGRKFDPHGDYVRHFIPELVRLEDRHIHAPWEAPPDILAKAGIVLDKDYPRPIVDLGRGRDRALEAFTGIRTAS